MFGLCLLNDWSARDMQSWEYQPLGPFLAKSFATTVGAWVVTLDALEPFRVACVRARGRAIPAPLAVPRTTRMTNRAADSRSHSRSGLRTAKMRAAAAPAALLSTGSFESMYWTVAQLLAHHSSNGCNLRPGDLLGSGTVSGPDEGSRGCLLELA